VCISIYIQNNYTQCIHIYYVNKLLFWIDSPTNNILFTIQANKKKTLYFYFYVISLIQCFFHFLSILFGISQKKMCQIDAETKVMYNMFAK